MNSRIPVVFAWSGGKDSAYALYRLLQNNVYTVRYLLSTFNGCHRRLSMHGVREEMIEAQAERLGIPLLKVFVYGTSNEEYEQRMGEMLLRIRQEGISVVAFGDIFLEDLRAYREDKMRAVGMDCIFPIWKIDTRQLTDHFISEGFKTITCCVSDTHLNEHWCGREIDREFIRELPAAVDPCGENGEFHSFCFAGPLFSEPLPVLIGEKLYKPLELKTADDSGSAGWPQTGGFWFCDLFLTKANT
jgi:uncharacterized protein (TIGR00290 family)